MRQLLWFSIALLLRSGSSYLKLDVEEIPGFTIVNNTRESGIDYSDEDFITVTCVSDYPVQMQYDFNLLNLTALYFQSNNQYTQRTLKDFWNTSTYTYTAYMRTQLKYLYKLRIIVCRNYRNVSIPKWIQFVKTGSWKAGVTMVSGGEIGVNVYNAVPYPAIESDYASNNECEIRFEVEETENGAKWRCIRDKEDNNIHVKIQFAYCYSQIHCSNLLREKQILTQQHCVKRVQSYETCESCKEAYLYLPQTKIYHPQLVICTSKTVQRAVRYFYTFGPNGEPSSHKQRFDWDALNLETETLFIKPLPTSEFKVNTSVEVECHANQYYFSFGYRIGIEINGTIELAKGGTPHSYKRDPVTNARIIKEVVKFTNSGTGYIHCFAPLAASDNWINRSVPIIVTPPDEYEYYDYDYEDAYNKNLTKIKKRFKKNNVKPKSNALLIAGIVGGMSLMTIAVVLVFSFRLHKMKKKLIKLTTEEIKEFMDGVDHQNSERTESFTVESLPYNSKYEIPKSQITFDKNNILGFGAYGTVSKGIAWIGKELVEIAVKTVRPGAESSYIKALLSELKVMAYLENGHNNIAHLVAACTENLKNNELYIGVELCQTSLLSALRDSSKSFVNLVADDDFKPQSDDNKSWDYENVRTTIGTEQMTTLDLFKWSYQIADAMSFLAEKRVIHGDLSLRNVLLTSNKEAKICDFGLARQMIDYNYIKTEQCPLPWKWMAIESLSQMKFSTKSDVWSYGIALWEMYSLGQVPYPGLNWTPGFIKELEKGLRMGKPLYATEKIYVVMMQTWNVEPSNRPDFNELKNFFAGYHKPLTM